MSLASFVIPAYKRRFLKEAIDSILAQTCRDFELVIVDDKSPEGLYEVIKEYPWEPKFETLPDGGRKWIVDGIAVRYYQNKENIGGRDLVEAWEKALAYASNDWCVLASDDDFYMPTYLAEMVRLANKYPKVDVCFCRLATIDATGKLVNVQCERREYESGIRFSYNTFKYHRQAAAEFMFRKSALEKLGGYVKFPCAWGSDDSTWSELAFENGAACSKDLLFVFRRSGLNITTSTHHYYEKMIAAVEQNNWAKTFFAKAKPETEEERFMVSDTCACRADDCEMTVKNAARAGGVLRIVRLLRDQRIPYSLRITGLKTLVAERLSPLWYYSRIKRWFR